MAVSGTFGAFRSWSHPARLVNLAWEHRRFPWTFDDANLNIIDCGDLVFFWRQQGFCRKMEAHVANYFLPANAVWVLWAATISLPSRCCAPTPAIFGKLTLIHFGARHLRQRRRIRPRYDVLYRPRKGLIDPSRSYKSAYVPNTVKNAAVLAAKLMKNSVEETVRKNQRNRRQYARLPDFRHRLPRPSFAPG